MSSAGPCSTIRPKIHHPQTIRHVTHDREVMADEQVSQPQPLLQVPHQVQDLRLDRDVQRAGRLVAHQEIRLARQRAGDGDALALPAGELDAGIFRHPATVSPTCGQQGPDPGLHLVRPRRQPKRPDRFGDDVAPPASADSATRKDPGKSCSSAAATPAERGRRTAVGSQTGYRRHSGSYSPTARRATVDLPQPDSPTSAKVVPGAMVNDTSSTARSVRRRSPAKIRCRNGRGHSKSAKRPQPPASSG